MKLTRNLFVVAFLAVLVACGGAEERKAAYMEKAEKSLNAGDLDKARIELKNVLQIDPKDARAYFQLGNIFDRKKEFAKAFGNYSKAAELDPENLEYHAKIGRYYLILAGDVQKAKEKLELIQSKDKENINGRILEAGILLKEGNVSRAIEITRDIFQSHPENLENSLFLASLYTRDKQYKDSISVLNEAIKFNPGNQSLLNTLANTLFANKEYKRAEQVLIEILNTHQDVFQNHLILASFYQKTNEPAKAEEILRSAINADEDDVQRKLVLIEFIKQVKGNKDAINELESMINNNQGEGSLRLALAQLQIAEKDIDGAISTYKQALKDFSDEETGVTSRVQLAKIYMQKEDKQSAISIIDEAAEIAPNDSQVNLVKAKIALVNNNIEQAIISLRTVIKDNPDNIDAYFLLAASHKANNEADQANDTIARAYENNRDNIKVLLPLAKYHLQNKNAVDAEKVIDDYLRLDADNYEALSIKSGVLNSKKNYTEAYKLAEKMVSLHPEKENGYIQSVPALLSNNEPDKAIDLLDNGYQKTNSIQIMKLMAEIQIVTGKAADAATALEALEEKDESIQLLIAKAYAANKDLGSAKKTLLDSIMQDKTRTQSYISLASVHSSEGDNNQAISVLQDGVNANPDDVRLGITLAGFYEKTGEIDSAIQQYEAILANKADNLLANNNLAALLSDHRSDDVSLKRAKEIADKLKDVNQPVIQDTVGWVYYKTANYTDAVTVLEKVVTAQPDIPVFNYHLGMAYQKAGNAAEAKKYLEAALAPGKEFEGKAIAEQTLKGL